MSGAPSETWVVQTVPGFVARWRRVAEAGGLPFRVMRVHPGSISPGDDEEEEDHVVVPMLVKQETAAKVLDLSTSSLRRLVRDGKLPTVRVNGCTRIRVEDLRAFVERLDEKDEDRG